MKKIITLLTLLLILCIVNVFAQNADFNVNGNMNTMIPTFKIPLTVSASWFTLSPSPHAVSRSCCAYIKINDTGYVYQFGGGSGAQYTNVAKYNVVTSTWTNSVSVIPSQMSAASAVALKGDSLIYLFGGNAPLGLTFKYNVISNTWTPLATMPTPVTDEFLVKWNDTLIYVICGGDGLFGAVTHNTVQLYNVHTNTYSACTNYPVSVSMLAGGIYGDTIIAAGGWTGAAGQPQAYKGKINSANPTTITWTSLPNYPTGGLTRMASYFAFKGTGGGVMFTGGAIDGATISNATNFFDICNNAWVSGLPTLPTGRSNMKGTGRGDSIIFVIAGYNGASGIGNSDRITFSQIDGNCITPVGIIQNGNRLPISFNLEQNYPNPFNPTTIISYSIKNAVHVKLTVYDVLGNVVKTLVNEIRQSGNHSVEFDASALASGIYFYTLAAGDFKDTKKMMLVK